MVLDGEGLMARPDDGPPEAKGSQNNSADWKFPEKRDTRAYLSNAVLKHKETITFVCHEKQAWQFLGDSMAESGAAVVCLHHPIDEDPSLQELADLPLGWYAERQGSGARWIRGEMLDEEARGEAVQPPRP